MKNNKGFATSFMLFSLLVLFLMVLSGFMLTMNNSTTLNTKVKNKLIDNIEEIDRSSIEQLIVYYDGKENGNISGYWQDISENNNNGQLYGATYQNQKYYNFDGDDYITINELNTSKITYEVVFSVDEFEAGNIILSNYNNGGCGLQEVVNDNKNVIKGSCFINNEEKIVYSSEITEGTIYDIALTYDKRILKIYVNGILSNSLEANNSITYPASFTNMIIGSNTSHNGSFFKGNIYDVKIYKGALSAGQINTNYTNNYSRYDEFTNNVFTYDYTGEEKIFTVPETGVYQLETWGASGNTPDTTSVSAGYGGYSIGSMYLTAGTTLYINVGGAGESSVATTSEGGYNGGGSSKDWSDGRGAGSGGGATHIALDSGELSSLSAHATDGRILIVSGGGGGVGNHTGVFTHSITAGSGGGFKGVNGISDSYIGYGGTQESGGNITTNSEVSVYVGSTGSFGTGGSCSISQQGNCSGGGAGYYGGGSNTNYSGAAGGGSGYIGNSLLTEKSMYCYNCEESNVKNTKTISTTGTSSLRDTTNCPNGYSEDAISKCAKKGNGYVKITKVQSATFTEEYAYTGSYQTFTAPKNGEYTIELWGAQGGTISGSNKAGYTKGNINLTQGETIYVYVGQQGDNTSNSIFNGGGLGGPTNSSDTTKKGQSGGGATDIRYFSSTPTQEDLNWDSSIGLASRIMVAAGSGGGTDGTYYENAGGNSVAGGLSGYDGGYYSGHPYVNQNGKGATQLQGGAAGVNHFDATGTNEAGSFGIGGSSNSASDSIGSGGGGGGYYGGGSGGATLSEGCGQGGGGGSSYISGHLGSIAITSSSDLTQRTDSLGSTCSIESALTDSKCSEHFSGKVFTGTVMKSGIELLPKIDGSGNETGHTGSGYAKISWTVSN